VKITVLASLVVAAGALQGVQTDNLPPVRPAVDLPGAGALDEAQRLFYNARYEAAAELMRGPCFSDADGMAACELRSTALHFQIRRALGEPADKDKAWKGCVVCPDLLTAFQLANGKGQALARARVALHPNEEATLFLLSKLALNHVWLQLGTLGHKTGWNEYWEARKTLDRLLKQNPTHVRARVARAWIDYIVDTKMPRGTRWLLGGGNKKRGLLAVREAADAEAEFFVKAEARFALWDMQVREKNLPGAIATARTLVQDFPENVELNRFLETHDSSTSR
jgi:hypothetical protein